MEERTNLRHYFGRLGTENRSGPVAATLGRTVGGVVKTTSGSGGHHARPIRTLCGRRPAWRTAGAPGCRPLSSIAESARGGRKRTRSTTSPVGVTAGGRGPECHEDRAGGGFPFPC